MGPFLLGLRLYILNLPEIEFNICYDQIFVRITVFDHLPTSGRSSFQNQIFKLRTWKIAVHLVVAGDVLDGVFLCCLFPRDVSEEIWD